MIQYLGFVITFIVIWFLIGIFITGPQKEKQEKLHREKVEKELEEVKEELRDLKKENKEE